ncbi:sigma-70 family RNA polymerase sigma factor [Rhodospirillum sp. A1_3_36]|uniref:sigma-70 family RNA polymerase sigma factor n=1 Tax=Rhodospirillum sp. A1_3_36 TaxID=3391666 RepID=UPI0039A50977
MVVGAAAADGVGLTVENTRGPEVEWNRFIPALTAFVRRRVANPADVENVVQTALTKAVAALPDLRRVERLESWLYRVTRGAVIDYYRVRSRRRESVLDDFDMVAADLPLEPDAELLEEMAACATCLLAELPKTYRDVLDLVDRRGMRQAEAARCLGLGLPALKSRVRRGRLLLRSTLEHCCQVGLDAGGRPMEFENRCAGNTSNRPVDGF